MLRCYQPVKIHPGVGQLNELGHVCRGYRRTCFLITTPDTPLQPLYERVKGLLDTEGISVIHFNKVEPNPSVEIIEQGFTILKEQPADFVLAVGGGSSIDAAKAIAFAGGKESIDWNHLFNEYSSPFTYYPSYSEKHLPLLSVPTASGTGSQVAQAVVITRGKEKITFFHPSNSSQETILGPQPMLTLPKRMSAATGFDAFTHAFGSYINASASPCSAMDSTEAMWLVTNHLSHVLEDLQSLGFRTDMCLVDTLAGRALANSGMGAPHLLSEIIDRIVYLLHEEVLVIVFPALVQHMADKNKERFVNIAKLFGSNDLYTAMIESLGIIGFHKKSKDFGASEKDFQEIPASPVLDHLPFGSREELEVILKDSCA